MDDMDKFFSYLKVCYYGVLIVVFTTFFYSTFFLIKQIIPIKENWNLYLISLGIVIIISAYYYYKAHEKLFKSHYKQEIENQTINSETKRIQDFLDRDLDIYTSEELTRMLIEAEFENYLNKSKSGYWSELDKKKEDIEKANIGDIFTNIDSIKYFGKEMRIKQRYEYLDNETRKSALKHWGYYRWFDAGNSLILALGTFLLILFPIMRLLNGEITIGTIVFIYTSYTTLFGPLFGFVNGMKGFYRSMADFESLFQYGKIENEIKDKENAIVQNLSLWLEIL